MTRRPGPCLLGAIGLAVFGSVLVSVGTWLAWPAFGPFYEGPIPGVPIVGTIEQGYQPVDVPIVAVAIGGTLRFVRHPRHSRSGRLMVGAGIAVFFLAVTHTIVARAGPFGLRWGYHVTLFGALSLLLAGVLRDRVCLQHH